MNLALNASQPDPAAAARPAGLPLDPALAVVRQHFVNALPDRILRFEALKQMVTGQQHTPLQVLSAIADLAHKIAGVAETLGFAQVGQMAIELDRKITTGIKAQMPPGELWAAVSLLLERLLDEMEARIDP